MKKNNKTKMGIFTYISFALLGLMLVLLCAMGIAAQMTGGVGVINAVLKISMYVVFGLSAVSFIIGYILDVKRRRDGRK